MAISSVLVNFLLFWGLALLLANRSNIRIGFGYLNKIFMFVGLTWLLTTALAYLFTPIFYDHAEVNIASVAAYWGWGHPIYTELQDSSRYSLLYGPIPYLIAGTLQGLGNQTIFLSKLFGVLSLLASLFFVYLYTLKISISRSQRVLVIALIALTFCGFYNYSYWIRPDSLLILFVILGLCSIKLVKFSIWKWILLGSLAGLSSGAKLHGVIYFLPLFAFCFQTSDRKWLPVSLIGGAGASILFLLLPFQTTGVSLNHYIEWMQMASKHGLEWDLFIKNLTFIGSFLLLGIVLGFYRKYRLTFITTVLSSVIISLIGSKSGAGTNHLMPLLSFILLVSFQSFLELPPGQQKRLWLAIGAFILTLSINGLNRQKRVWSLLTELSQRSEEFQDLRSLVERHPSGVELGYSNIDNYISTFYKPWVVARSNTLFFDGASLMDMRASQIEIPIVSLAALNSCNIKRIILPREGNPWELESFYKGQMLFSKEFKQIFTNRYRLQETTTHFRLYECSE